MVGGLTFLGVGNSLDVSLEEKNKLDKVGEGGGEYLFMCECMFVCWYVCACIIYRIASEFESTERIIRQMINNSCKCA